MANCERATSPQLGLKSGEIVNLAESWSNFLQPSTPLEIGSFRGALDPQVSETHNYFLFQTFRQHILCWTLSILPFTFTCYLFLNSIYAFACFDAL